MASNSSNGAQNPVQLPDLVDDDDDIQFLGFFPGAPQAQAAPAPAPANPLAAAVADEPINQETECVVCTSQMFLPTKVPGCNHTFCFTCLKAISLSASAGCPICRGEIDIEVFKQARDINLKMKTPGEAEPDFSVRRFVNNQGEELEEVKPDVEVLQAQMNAEAARIFWVYAGRNHGHWRYEPRTEQEIEEAFNAGVHQEITILAMGRNYKVNFEDMHQFPEGHPEYARPIRRLTAQEFDELTNDNLINGIAGAVVNRN